MNSTPVDDWSPADNPYAIAVSEANWWKEAVRLTIVRMRRNDDAQFGWMSPQQIDARQLVFALRQLLSAEKLEQFALDELDIDLAVRDGLTQARHRFEASLPGIKHMRDGLMHFEDWSRGMGRYGPQAERRDAGDLPRDIAREFWGFGFNPSTGIVSFGPYAIEIEAALKAAQELALRIYLAAREVDKRNTAELRSKTISALANSGMIVDRAPSLGFKVSPGDDLRVWISLDRKPGTDEGASGDLAVRIVNALASAGLRLVSNIDNDDRNSAARMIGGESLYVEADE